MSDNIIIGKYGEITAASYLENKGFKLLALNYRYKKSGEIDIIAKDKNEIVFVEVKTRKNVDFGYPSEFVDKRKQKKIKKTANAYLTLNNIEHEYSRFDIIEIITEKKNMINHLKNAF